jgi:hypothetical protein
MSLRLCFLVAPTMAFASGCLEYFSRLPARSSRAGLVKDKRLEELICSNTARSLMRMPLRADSEPAALASPSARGVYHAPN